MSLPTSLNVVARVGSRSTVRRRLGAQEPSAKSALVVQAFQGRGGGELTPSSVGSDRKSIIIAY